MRQPRLIKSYSRLSDQNLAFKAKMVVLSLTGNESFPVTTPTLVDFSAKKDEFVLALQNSARGDKTAISHKKAIKEELLVMMNNLATNVQSLAVNDRTKMVSSGFDLGSEGESAPPITGPKNFEITDGLNKGELRTSVKGEARAIAYVHEYTEEPLTENSIWIAKTSSSRENLFGNLTSGKKAFARVAIVGRKGQEVYSEILSRMVQ